MRLRGTRRYVNVREKEGFTNLIQELLTSISVYGLITCGGHIYKQTQQKEEEKARTKKLARSPKRLNKKDYIISRGESENYGYQWRVRREGVE